MQGDIPEFTQALTRNPILSRPKLCQCVQIVLACVRDSIKSQFDIAELDTEPTVFVSVIELVGEFKSLRIECSRLAMISVPTLKVTQFRVHPHHTALTLHRLITLQQLLKNSPRLAH